MFLSAAAKYVRLTWEIKKLNILAAMEYRTSFIMQVLFGSLIDISFGFLWIIYFQKFPVLENWTLQDTLLMLSVAWMGPALVYIISGGVPYLAQTIVLGQLDYFLALPHN